MEQTEAHERKLNRVLGTRAWRNGGFYREALQSLQWQS